MSRRKKRKKNFWRVKVTREVNIIDFAILLLLGWWYLWEVITQHGI